MKLLSKLLLASGTAAGAVWGWRKLRERRPDGNWRLALPQLSAGASAHVDAASASWQFHIGAPPRISSSEPAPLAALPAAEAFYVYDDASHARARIHRASCRYCNDGEGTRPGEPTTGEWRGPFADFQQAQSAANALELRDTAACRICCADLPD